MPITQIESASFIQTCVECGTDRAMSLGEATPEDTDTGDHLIRLPPCAQCNSVELLVPLQSDPDDHPAPGGYGHLHRLMVEELDERLTPARANAARSAKRAKRFPDGFTLAMPRELLPNSPKTER